MTSSAAAGCSSPASPSSRSPRWPAASRRRPAWLLGARAVQGIGAAIAAPSTLALLTTTFREGRERTRAIAYYSAVAGGGGSVGLVLGGMLTDWISWRWGLFINVPDRPRDDPARAALPARDRAPQRPLRPHRRR